jgi:hypothetical protein
MSASALSIRHGYTLRDLDRLAHTVVTKNAQWWPAGDRRDQIDTAWSGIVEHLYATDGEPTENDLLDAGTRALVEDTKGYRKHHGLRDGGYIGDGPRFAAYWYEPPAQPWEERVIERLAAQQILPRVNATHLEAVLALAATGDYADAADALGLKYSALTVRLSEARKTFRRHWFAPDSAPPVKGTDRRTASHSKPLATHCQGGKGPHEMTPENTYRRPNPKPGKRGERVCKACETERSQRRYAARKAAA